MSPQPLDINQDDNANAFKPSEQEPLTDMLNKEPLTELSDNIETEEKGTEEEEFT